MFQDQTTLLLQIDEVIGMYLMTMRIESKLQYDKVCTFLDISPSKLRAYERGELPIPASKLYLFANLIEVKMDFFFMDLLNRLKVQEGFHPIEK